jgi:arylsulfatase A-like enzyme
MPTVAMWPNVIPAQSIISVPTSQMDVFTTIHQIVNISIPNDRIIDGQNILPLLRNPRNLTSPHKYLFHYCGSYLHGVRYIEDSDNVWKLYYFTPKYKVGEYKCPFVCMCFGDYVIQHNPPLFYNIAKDPAEDYLIDINSSPRYQKIYQEINKAVESHKKSITYVESQFSFSNTIWR